MTIRPRDIERQTLSEQWQYASQCKRLGEKRMESEALNKAYENMKLAKLRPDFKWETPRKGAPDGE